MGRASGGCVPGAPIHASRELRLQAARACSEASATVARSRALADQFLGILASGPPSDPVGFFFLQGRVESHRVCAMWWQGRIFMSRALRDRADVLVAIGERFESEDGATITADLGEPVSAMATSVRACDWVWSLTLGPLSTADGPAREAGR